MTYEEFMEKLHADPAYCTKVTKQEMIEMSADWDRAERASALAEHTRVCNCVVGFNDVIVAHPGWDGDLKMTSWGIQLLSWAGRQILKQSWADKTEIDLADLWEFQRKTLEALYEVWYKGTRAPSQWE